MAEVYLTTDIIVIIVLVVVLILVGIGAFFIHYYWTKIGVSEIWNTAKWSSIRSSVYRSVSRFSRASRSKPTVDSPYNHSPRYNNDVDGFYTPEHLESKKSMPVITSYVLPQTRYSTNDINILSFDNSRGNPIPSSYGTKIGQPIDNTTIYNIHEFETEYDSSSSTRVQKQRF